MLFIRRRRSKKRQVTALACTDCIVCCQPTISMSRVSRLPGVEFAFFSLPCPANWTRNRQCLLSVIFPHGRPRIGALRSLR